MGGDASGLFDGSMEARQDEYAFKDADIVAGTSTEGLRSNTDVQPNDGEKHEFDHSETNEANLASAVSEIVSPRDDRNDEQEKSVGESGDTDSYNEGVEDDINKEGGKDDSRTVSRLSGSCSALDIFAYRSWGKGNTFCLDSEVLYSALW